MFGGSSNSGTSTQAQTVPSGACPQPGGAEPVSVANTLPDDPDPPPLDPAGGGRSLPQPADDRMATTAEVAIPPSIVRVARANVMTPVKIAEEGPPPHGTLQGRSGGLLLLCSRGAFRTAARLRHAALARSFAPFRAPRSALRRELAGRNGARARARVDRASTPEGDRRTRRHPRRRRHDEGRQETD